jgi:hypothetical protein
MNSKVKVVADATTGAVIVQSENNPLYGYIRLEQTRVMIDDNGFVKPKNISALLQGEVENLKSLNLYAGQELPGNILIFESLEPFNKKNPERDLKIAGETGIVCTKEGQPIYRKTRYSANPNETDGETIKHDNVDQLRAAYATKSSAISANQNFDNIG